MEAMEPINAARIQIHRYIIFSNNPIRGYVNLKKKNTVHMRYKIKESKQQYSMRTHFKGFKHDP
jgi:hypothetical protein